MKPWAHFLAAALLAPLPSLSADLSRTERRIVEDIDRHRDDLIALLERAVNIPSATENLDGVRTVGDLFAQELRGLGFTTTWVELPPETGRAGHLVAERAGKKGKGLLLIGHLDTVVEGESFRRDGDRGYGSGAADMKGGDAILIEALRALQRVRALDDRPIIVVMTGDEENPGTPHEVSRKALLDAARRSDIALAFEGAVPGVAVVGRRGIGSWRLEVTGSQGHSSGIFGSQRGSGAIFEAGRILSAFHDQLREPYLTYNPSLIVGGTDVEYDRATTRGTASGKLNVVSKRVVVEGDLRFLSPEQLDRARQRMRAIAAVNLPQTSAAISFQDGMPSMPPTDGNRALLRRLDQVSRDLGAEPIGEQDPSQRGAGDIAFVADLVDGLDGLGAMGEQEHAPGEYVALDKLPLLTKRAALLIYRLTSPEPPAGRGRAAP